MSDYINHIKYLDHSAKIINLVRELRNDLQSGDITLFAGGRSVRAHRFILFCSSGMFRTLLHGIPDDEEVVIILADIKGELLDKILDFIYLGEIKESLVNLTEMIEVFNMLGIFPTTSLEITSKVEPVIDAGLTTEFTQFQGDVLKNITTESGKADECIKPNIGVIDCKTRPENLKTLPHDYMETARDKHVLQAEPIENIKNKPSTLTGLAKEVQMKKFKSEKDDQIAQEPFSIRLQKAAHACLHDGFTLKSAATMYGIPNSTFWRYMQKPYAATNNTSNDGTNGTKKMPKNTKK